MTRKEAGAREPNGGRVVRPPFGYVPLNSSTYAPSSSATPAFDKCRM
jgi:hypothetical protein